MTSEEVVIQLLLSKCMRILMYRPEGFLQNKPTLYHQTLSSSALIRSCLRQTIWTLLEHASGSSVTKKLQSGCIVSYRSVYLFHYYLLF